MFSLLYMRSKRKHSWIVDEQKERRPCNGGEKWNVYILWLPYIKYSNLSWNWFFISFYAATKSRLLPPLMISVSQSFVSVWTLSVEKIFIYCYFLINLSACQSTFHHLLLHDGLRPQFKDYVSVFWSLQKAPLPYSYIVWHIDSYDDALGCRSINQFEIGSPPSNTFHAFNAL